MMSGNRGGKSITNAHTQETAQQQQQQSGNAQYKKSAAKSYQLRRHPRQENTLRLGASSAQQKRNAAPRDRLKRNPPVISEKLTDRWRSCCTVGLRWRGGRPWSTPGSIPARNDTAKRGSKTYRARVSQATGISRLVTRYAHTPSLAPWQRLRRDFLREGCWTVDNIMRRHRRSPGRSTSCV